MITWHEYPKEVPEFSGHYIVKFKEFGFSGQQHISTAWWMMDDIKGEHFWEIDCSEMIGFTPACWAGINEPEEV
jgi:hypothetical protein